MKKVWVLFWILLAVGMVTAAVFTTKAAIKNDVPSSQPTRTDIIPAGTVANDIVKTNDEANIPSLMQPSNTVRDATDRLISKTCSPGTNHCKLQAIYDFVRRGFTYQDVSLDHNYIQSPTETLFAGAGDSIELALLIASMQRAAGFKNEILKGPYHAFVRVTDNNQTFLIDPSCQSCSFRDVRVAVSGSETIYS